MERSTSRFHQGSSTFLGSIVFFLSFFFGPVFFPLYLPKEFFPFSDFFMGKDFPLDHKLPLVNFLSARCKQNMR